MTSIAILGAGAMGSAIGTGLLDSGWDKLSIRYADVDLDRVGELVKDGFIAYSDPSIAAESASIVLIAVKPQGMGALLGQIAPVISPAHLVISIVAGVSSGTIEAGLAAGVPVVRCMPNTPALLGEGATALAGGANTSDENLARAEQVLGAVGRTVVVTEAEIDAVTGVSGSGPAYVFLLAEAMEEAAIAEGLEPTTARLLVGQTIKGAGDLLMASPKAPAELRQQVTSPNGTTEAALLSFENAGFRRIVRDAVAKAVERSRELGREHD
jgi:pyrroline-5-carboxylate reductase